MFDPMVCDLIRLRLRWWAITTSRLLIRHWQWFVLAGVLVPMDAPLRSLLLFLTQPLRHVFESGHDIGWHIARVGLIQCIASVWVIVQCRTLSGGEFAPYLRTLPLTASQRLMADAVVLVTADTLLLVPVIAALLLAPAPSATAGGEWLAKTGAVSVLTLLTQVALLESCLFAIAPVVAGGIVLSWILSGGPAFVGWTMLAVSFAVGLGALTQIPVRRRIFRSMNPTWYRTPPMRLAIPPAWRIQCKTLTSQISSLMRALALLAVVLGAHVLLAAFAFDGRSLPVTALALAVLALVTSGWYRTLRDARAPVSAYLNTLPLPSNFWRWQDIRFIATVGTLPASALLGSLLVHLPHRLSAVAMLVPGYWILLAILRFPMLHGGRQAILLAVLMTGAWSAVAIAATT